MVPMLLALMAVMAGTMAVAAKRTDNDPVLWGLCGLFMPFLAIFFLPGLLNGTITHAP